MADAALHSERADHVQHQVLGVDARLQGALHPDAAHLELVHGQALAGQHIAHLAGADAKGDRTEGAVGGGVGIAAGHGHAGLGEAQFGRNHVHDPLAAAAEAVQGDGVVGAVDLQGGQHRLGQGIGEGPSLGGGGHDVVHRGHGALRVPHREPQIPQGCEGLGAGDLMDQVESNEQLGGATRQIRHPVQLPDLVVEGAGAHAEA